MMRSMYKLMVAGLLCVLVAGPSLVAAPLGLPGPSQSAVNEATSITWRFRYSQDYSPGINDAYSCGRLFVMALASYTGNTSADYRMFKQIRYNLLGDHCITATGGYESQHERIWTGSCALIRRQPRLWNQLTAYEQYQMDLLMKASLIASAYTTSDDGNEDGQNRDMAGDSNLGRGWNPNFREGMIGGMLVATAYFGGGDAANEILDNYDHTAFTAELAAAGLTNTYNTFNARATNPYAPTAAMIQADIDNYRYYNMSLNELMDIYYSLTTYTYDKYVNTGLNGGLGINGGGKMVAGQAGLPNVGVQGMLHEFDGGDAYGARSSIGYAYDGFRPNIINQIVLIVSGYWEPGSMANTCAARMAIGVPDLYYKLTYGYINYANGHVGGTAYITDDGHDYTMMESVWEDVIKRFGEGSITVASAGWDQTVIDEGLSGTVTVTLDGSASYPADGRTITAYLWQEGSDVIAAGVTADVELSVGEHEINLTTYDSVGGYGTDTVVVTVDLPDLVAEAGEDRTVADVDGDGFELVWLDACDSFAKDTTITTWYWTEGATVHGLDERIPVFLPLGEHTITLTVTDDEGNRDTDTVVITVAEATLTPGDADGDGDVDLNDFVILKTNFGRTDAAWSDGDFNGDQAVDLNDFVLLKNNFGS